MKLILFSTQAKLNGDWVDRNRNTQNNHGSFEPFAHGPHSVSREIVATASYSGDIVNVSVAAIAGDKLTGDVRLGHYYAYPDHTNIVSRLEPMCTR